MGFSNDMPPITKTRDQYSTFARGLLTCARRPGEPGGVRRAFSWIGDLDEHKGQLPKISKNVT